MKQPMMGAVLVSLLTACGAAPSPTIAEARAPAIASVWRSRCGSCHVPGEPGSHSRQALDEALRRHRKRVRLTEDEWGEMTAFLAAEATSASR